MPGEGVTAPLTWAQRAMFEILTREPRPDDNHNISLAVRVRNGRDTAETLGRLRRVLDRHESPRSTVGPGPVQRILPAGAVEVACHPLDDPARESAALARELRRTPLGFGGRACARADLVTWRGEPHTLLLTFSHLAIDGGALEPLRSEIAAGLAGRVPAGTPLSPRERAAYERGEDGRRRSARALEQVEAALLERVPLAFPPGTSPPRSPRHWIGRLDSVSAGPAASAVAAGHRLSPPAVLTGVVAALLGLRAGEPAVPLLVIVGNRFEPGLRDYVGPLSQMVPVNIAVEAGSLLGTASRAAGTLTRAYLGGQFDPIAQAELTEKVQAGRGVRFDLPTMLNVHPSWAAAFPGPPTRVPDARGEFVWESCLDGPHLPHFYLNVFTTRGRTSLHLEVDTARASPEEAEAFLRGIEAVLAALVDGDMSLDDVRALAGAWGG